MKSLCIKWGGSLIQYKVKTREVAAHYLVPLKVLVSFGSLFWFYNLKIFLVMHYFLLQSCENPQYQYNRSSTKKKMGYLTHCIVASHCIRHLAQVLIASFAKIWDLLLFKVWKRSALTTDSVVSERSFNGISASISYIYVYCILFHVHANSDQANVRST